MPLSQLVMAGDVALLLPTSSDFYVNNNSLLLSTFLKLSDIIPAEAWEELQQATTDDLLDIARLLFLSSKTCPYSRL